MGHDTHSGANAFVLDARLQCLPDASDRIVVAVT